jgi:membrane-bound lytic murein transglycosylase D
LPEIGHQPLRGAGLSRSPRYPRPGLIPAGLLLLGFLAGCGTRPTSSPDVARTTPPPGASGAFSDSLHTRESRLVDGWELAFRNGRALEGSQPDSVIFFRFQALLAHLNPEEISPEGSDLRNRAEALRTDVSAARDAAWLRWQSDLTPPPPPRPQTPGKTGLATVLPDNPRVTRWITWFTGDGRERFAVWIWRSGAYRMVMEQILREEGVPPEMVGMVFIESGFQLAARSRARAVGPWQFVAATARRYGLAVNRHRDERRDFVLSTRAAAHYLKDLYDLFGDWELVLAAYNCGEGRVFRQIAKQKITDYWNLDLPRETDEYVPKFYAALAILAQPEKHGFSTVTSEPLAWDEVDLPAPVRVADLARHCGLPVEDVKALNPAWLRSITPADGNPVKARLPLGAGGKLVLASLPVVPPSEARAAGGTHRVRSGETLGRIARRYGVSVTALARENGLNARSILRTGRVLRLPDDAVDPPARKKAAAPARSKSGSRASTSGRRSRPAAR